MAYLKFSHEQINYLQPTVAMILNWFSREFKAKIKVHKQTKFGGCTYRVVTRKLPDELLNVTCEELVPGVIIINCNYAGRF
jgi:hypothetical protein